MKTETCFTLNFKQELFKSLKVSDGKTHTEKEGLKNTISPQ